MSSLPTCLHIHKPSFSFEHLNLNNPLHQPEQNSDVPSSTLNRLQIQLYDTQTFLASYVDKVRALESVFAEREAIKGEVAVLRQLVETETTSQGRHEEKEYLAWPTIMIREASEVWYHTN